MNTIKSFIFSLSSLLLLISEPLSACSEYPGGEETRMGSFYQLPRGMYSYLPFIYTYDLYYFYDSDDPYTQVSDKEKIIDEWAKAVGDDISKKDIEVILYQAPPNMFLLSEMNNKLTFTFEGNTFINFLVLPENKSFLSYLTILKQMEFLEFYLSDNWSDQDRYSWFFDIGIQNKLFNGFCIQYTKKCKELIAENQNEFLKTRYLFQLAKMLLKTRRHDECKKIIAEFFKIGDKTILNNAMFHYQGVCNFASGDTAAANLSFARSFRLGNERKFRNMQLFCRTQKSIDKSILLTSSKSEKALLVALGAIRNPGRALNQLKRVEQFDSHIPEFLFLVHREVNKLDDWIATPFYTNFPPSVIFDIKQEEYYSKVTQINLKKDKVYLKEFITWLSDVKEKFSGEPKQYLDLAYVHLCLLNEDFNSASNCYNSIKIDHSSAYFKLYTMEQIYLKIMGPSFDSDNNLNTIAKLMSGFENTATHDPLQRKMLTTLNKILSYKMSKIGRIAYAGLIELKSEAYKNSNFNSFNSEDRYYYYYKDIYWFDKHASIADVDTLIALSLNTHKKPFQKFYGDSILCPTDFYRDLKGTMAFRSGNIYLANATFKQIVPDFWGNDFYKYYLNEDPFIPKHWPQKRNINYKFSKAIFTSQLIDLTTQTKSKEPEIAAKAWLQLGHGYFNTTYWGNSWMMCMYSQSSSPDSEIKINKSFYDCSNAKRCYLNVIKRSKNKELIATAVFMLHACDMYKAFYKYELLDYNKRPEHFYYKSLWLKDFAIKYKDTKVFQEYLSNCSYLNEYMKKGYLILGNN